MRRIYVKVRDLVCVTAVRERVLRVCVCLRLGLNSSLRHNGHRQVTRQSQSQQLQFCGLHIIIIL